MAIDLLTAPEDLTYSEAAELLKCTVAEVAALVDSHQLAGNSFSVRTSTVRAYIEHRNRALLASPPKQVTLITWPRAHE